MLGSGKTDELAALVKERNADLVVFEQGLVRVSDLQTHGSIQRNDLRHGVVQHVVTGRSTIWVEPRYSVLEEPVEI